MPFLSTVQSILTKQFYIYSYRSKRYKPNKNTKTVIDQFIKIKIKWKVLYIAKVVHYSYHSTRSHFRVRSYSIKQYQSFPRFISEDVFRALDL